MSAPDPDSELSSCPQQAPSYISRRGLVFGGIGIAALFAVGGASRAFAHEQPLLRPPGGQDEQHLKAACIKCDRCRSACPQGVIDVAHVEDGPINARTPKLSFRKGFCDFCEGEPSFRCVDSCPTGALKFGFDSTQDKIGLARVIATECLLYRAGSGRCSKQCIEVCEFEALHVDASGQLVVDDQLCNGCGACEWACPSTSYASYTGSGCRGIAVEIAEAGRYE